MDLRLDDPDPRIRDLAYLLFLEELLGGKWVGALGSRAWEARCAAGVAGGGAANPLRRTSVHAGPWHAATCQRDDHALRYSMPDWALPTSGMAATIADRRAG